MKLEQCDILYNLWSFVWLYYAHPKIFNYELCWFDNIIFYKRIFVLTIIAMGNAIKNK